MRRPTETISCPAVSRHPAPKDNQCITQSHQKEENSFISQMIHWHHGGAGTHSCGFISGCFWYYRNPLSVFVSRPLGILATKAEQWFLTLVVHRCLGESGGGYGSFWEKEDMHFNLWGWDYEPSEALLWISRGLWATRYKTPAEVMKKPFCIWVCPLRDSAVYSFQSTLFLLLLGLS